MSPFDNPMMPTALASFSGSVFHYTSSAGLLGSLDSGCIRASAASSLNDLGEVRQGWELIRKLLGAEPASQTVDLLRRFADDPYKREHEVFILSASTSGDDANQWRLYADEGRGYAIELDGSVPLAAVSPIEEAAPSSVPRFGMSSRDVVEISPWQHVLYYKSDVKAALDELLNDVDAEDQSIGATSGMTADEREHLYEGLQEQAYDALATIAHLIKSPGFSGENEVRVVATFFWGEDHIRYRAAPHGIVGYANLTEAPGGTTQGTVLHASAPGKPPLVTSLPVKSVRLGPLLRPEQVHTVTSFLRANGLRAVDVTTSSVPLR